MKKKIIIAILIISVATVISLKSFAADNTTDKFTNWGKALKHYVIQEELQTLSSSNTTYAITSVEGVNLSIEEVPKTDIYMVGNKILITKSELELSQKFYEISGSDKETAKQEAEEYIKQENALYVKALEEGYTVTDVEVHKYLETLKQTLSNAENLIKAYGSEDEYWEYMFTVYQKDLPIQKYVSALEDKYAQKMGIDKTSEAFQEYWDTKFEDIKSDLTKKENFKTVKIETDNLKKFEVK